ncbi:B12-binding domain-containing radical SAM protein, partial [Planctomycetota bacterium]
MTEEAASGPFRVLLVRPAATYSRIDFPDGPRVGMPLGLLYIASAFRDDPGYETGILDALAYPDLDTVRQQRGRVRFGQSLAETLAEVVRQNPALVGVTCGAREFLDDCVDTVEAIRRALPETFIVAGGCDASSQPETYLQRAPGLDVAVVGEGEVTLRQLADRLRSKESWKDVSGIAYRDGGEIRRNPAQEWIRDLDAYQPDFSTIDLERYFRLNAEGFRSRGT